jgi:hypothetical protein
MEKLQWSALEYEEKERSHDWFWALGIIVVTSSIAAIIYGNYFFAVLLILSGVLLGFFAIKKPDVVFYELNEKGLQAKNRLYPYDNIKSFWVQRTDEELKHRPTLFIKSQRVFMPVISIPIDMSLAAQIRSMMLQKNVTEEEMKEHVSEKIMDSLGF